MDISDNHTPLDKSTDHDNFEELCSQCGHEEVDENAEDCCCECHPETRFEDDSDE